ncbi:MAG: septum formation initiator family protein [SAR324 cluster bacterium]|nr:septum formation initiator family protein [SAR324 cluster bacterium]MCZ6628835.1 septum formation initiator family protein [SAR324 cluster bacterium]MCZ6647572.1 septum formation initiator family protein [SAR324 cluster bacterium]
MQPKRPRQSRGMAARLNRWSERLPGWLRPSDRAGHPLDALPRYFFMFVLLFAMGMILVSLIGEQGMIAYIQLKGEARQLRSEVAALDARRVELAQEIKALRDDPAYIELLARRRLGLVRPGELIIQLPLRKERP